MTLDASARAATGDAIARVQMPDGSIPWYPGGPVDPWDHVEAAMGLDSVGRHAEAARAYAWLRATQRADGSWPSARIRGRVADATRDANFAAYIATGVWFHLLCSHDEDMVRRLWPAVDRAVSYAVGLQAPAGQIWWARDATGAVDRTALVTASSGVLLSLRCGSALAERLSSPRPDWELAATRLAAALRLWSPGAFAAAGRHAMDWYWPVLSGALAGAAAVEHLEAGWPSYVVGGLGVRCVRDRPWVTAAESAELVLSLVACGREQPARRLFADLQHLRDADGAYWTGYVYPDRVRWPVERTTWTAGAVLLAADALDPGSATRRLLSTFPTVLSGALSVDTPQYAQ